jgi:predicted AlkP superfamily phosphohydrolase/phosphomutase
MAEPVARKLLLVGWDAADWQMIHPLLDAGRMPNLKQLVEGGIMGNLLSLQPMLSPILWTSIATGKRAYLHGITGFVEPTQDRTALRPIASGTRRCKALWNILSQAGRRCHAVGWYASHPAEVINGICVSQQFSIAPASATPDDWPPQPNSVQPFSVADSLADLRLHPREITGATLAQFIPKAAHLDQRDPEVRRLLASFVRRLAECVSLHAVTTAVMEETPWDFCAAYYETIDCLGHDFMPFQLPRMPQVRPDLFEAFQNVMAGIYELHDQMLGRLIELAGADTHVMIVSDHGFLSGTRRPTDKVDPAQWHRNYGIFVLAGPGIKRDDIIHGATLLDIAPTVLALFGLPIGRDMEGKVLVNAFAKKPELERIASWEDVSDPAFSRPAGETEDDPEAAAAALQQLELRKEFPQEVRYAVLAGQAASWAGDAEALRGALDALEALQPDHAQILFFRASLCWLTGDTVGALQHLETAAANGNQESWLQCRIGRAYLRLRRWSEAEKAFRKSLAIDPDNAESFYGLSVALPRQGRLEEGVQCGLQAISLFHDFPIAHFQLGAVLSRLGWYDRALQAFEICLAMRPEFVLAHRYVSKIAARLGRIEIANKHRDIAKRIVAEGGPQPAVD